MHSKASGGLLRCWVAAAFVALAPWGEARADRFVAEGTAGPKIAVKPSSRAPRASNKAPPDRGLPGQADEAIASARAEALRLALDRLLEEPSANRAPGLEARRAKILAEAPAWTGSYRVLDTRHEGDAVRVTVEVEVDLDRLRKRLAQPEQTSAHRVFGIVGATIAPGTSLSLAEVKAALGAGFIDASLASTAKLNMAPLDLVVDCQARGRAFFALTDVASLTLELRRGKTTLARQVSVGLGATPVEACRAALVTGAAEVSAWLAEHRPDTVILELEVLGPAAIVRKVERALVDRVLGVEVVRFVGVAANGRYRLAVATSDAPAALGRKLEGLSGGGFSATMLGTRGPDGLLLQIDGESAAVVGRPGAPS